MQSIFYNQPPFVMNPFGAEQKSRSIHLLLQQTLPEHLCCSRLWGYRYEPERIVSSWSLQTNKEINKPTHCVSCFFKGWKFSGKWDGWASCWYIGYILGEREREGENINKWADMISGSVVKRTYFKTLGRERLAFVFLWDGFVTTSYTMLQTSIHSSSGTLSTR